MERCSLPTSSSKVTVECVDPGDLFSTFKPLLLKYLPLRNLHWKSSNRPLRSINTLHVELTKDGNDTASAPERRHQIPGLRQTPYVKIYLLRCDDNETYKATSRKQIREWVKSSAQQAESKKAANTQENHDAFEWLIIHLVVSESPAAAQTRISKEARLGSTDSSDSITNKSKWPGKGSSTVLEKLRADFNGSSKSAIDHVAQIRIPEDERQLSIDTENQFRDLVEKLKVTILTSFDLRVRQYEEDIREKDGQRSLPGWNFNTFFILKEGLARGFENVGLFDDALVGYDELAIGLDVIVHEQLDGTGSDHGGRFLPFSDELRNKIQACLKDTDEGAGANASPSYDLSSDPAGRLSRRDYPLDASKGPFRELILANEISIFDFRLYIFSRQLELLLRAANASSIADEPPESQPGFSKHEEHFLPLAEACQRALDFITRGARILRHDLESALDMSELISANERTFRSMVMSNFIHSWMYVSSLQVLAQTSSPDLILPPADSLPARAASPMKLGVLEQPPPNWTLSRTPSPMGMNMTGRSRPSNKPTNKTGGEELAGARAELYFLARAALQQMSHQHGWSRRLNVVSPGRLQGVTLKAGHHSKGESPDEQTRPVINGLQYLDLRNGFKTPDSFTTLFSCLTIFSYRHSLAANRMKSAEKALADIAILKYEAGEYEAAASYLGRIASMYRDSQWASLEATLLELYADCMKKLDRHGEYVSALLTLLGQTHGRQQLRSALSSDRYLADLLSFSKKLTTPVSAKLSDFFSIKGLASDIRHHQDRDGFFIPIELSFFLGGSAGPLEIPEGLQMTVSPIYDAAMQTVTLTGPPTKIGRSPKTIELNSNMSVCSWYAIDTFQIRVGNIVFLEDYKAMRLSVDDQPNANPHASLRFFVYPPSRSLQVAASPAPYLHLARPRSILLEMKTGWNEIQACTLLMKSATAGLRLRLHEATIDSEDGPKSPLSAGPNEGTQAIRLIDCPADSEYKISIPYTVENADIPLINAKLDVEYSTPKGKFTHSSFVAVNTILPISVNVQDVFQETALLSRFTISPATLVPLRLWSWDMQGSEGAYTIKSHVNVEGAMDVFPKQPASLMYKFTRLEPESGLTKLVNSLAISVTYSCLDEVVLKAMEKHFIASVARSPVANLVQPLCAHLLSTFRSQWSAQDLEIIGLCHEIEIWPFEDLGWEAVLMGFDAKARNLARTWLRKWHRDNAILPIYGDLGNEADVPSRLIVIPVDIPKPPIVVTASLDLDQRCPEVVTIDEALLAELKISYTKNWAANDVSLEENAQLEISFEVMAPPENWIIGGMRRGYLSAEQTVQSMPIVLLPQRTGHLLLPVIEVKCYKAESLNTGVVPSDGIRVPCEVDTKTLAQSVHVVSGLRETVVEIEVDAETEGQAANERRCWLAGSKNREAPGTKHSR